MSEDEHMSWPENVRAHEAALDAYVLGPQIGSAYLVSTDDERAERYVRLLWPVPDE